MSVWKKIQQENIQVSPYTARKNHFLTSSLLSSSFGVQFLLASASNGQYILGSNDTSFNRRTPLVYRSLKQLYYQSFNSSSGELLQSSSYEHYLESSIATGSRIIGTPESLVYSIPRSLIGSHIEPGTFVHGIENDGYIFPDYVFPGYFDELSLIFDDGEGNLIIDSGSRPRVGNIIYSHGLIIITDQTVVGNFKGSPSTDLTFKSNHTLYTFNYSVKLEEYEFNTTFNPTAQSGNTIYNYSGSRYLQPSGIKASNITGSVFTPYITTIGLYSDKNELLAVAKLSKPVPKTQDTDLTFNIKLDL